MALTKFEINTFALKVFLEKLTVKEVMFVMKENNHPIEDFIISYFELNNGNYMLREYLLDFVENLILAELADFQFGPCYEKSKDHFHLSKHVFFEQNRTEEIDTVDQKLKVTLESYSSNTNSIYQ